MSPDTSTRLRSLWSAPRKAYIIKSVTHLPTCTVAAGFRNEGSAETTISSLGPSWIGKELVGALWRSYPYIVSVSHDGILDNCEVEQTLC